MQLGLMTEPQVGGSYQRLLELARWAEERGLDAFARADHYLDQEQSAPATEALTSLGGLARETSRIQLVVLVSPLTFRHPGVLAKTAATLDEMSGGRFALGVGTGWMESEHEAFGIELYDVRERFSRLFETLGYLRAAFSGTDGYTGRHYRLASGIDVLPRPARLPIVIGGSGMVKTPTLAGRFADEYNMFATAAGTIERRIEAMREAARAADRDPDQITVSISSQVIMADTEAGYQELLAARGARRDMTADEYEALLTERNVPRGTPDGVRQVIAEYESLGMGRFYLQEYKDLDEIDTAELARVFSVLGR